MTRFTMIQPEQATGQTQDTLNAINSKMGTVPNIFKVMANSPASLQAFMACKQALSAGSLSPQLSEQIALAVAGCNTCDYCASAHSFAGQKMGLDATETQMNLQGKSSDSKIQCALQFAWKIVESKGNVSDSDLSTIRSAGFSEGEIIEIISIVCLNIFTNYINHIAATDIDFPKVSSSSSTAKAA